MDHVSAEKIALGSQCEPHDQCLDTHADCTPTTAGQPPRCLCQPGFYSNTQSCGLFGYIYINESLLRLRCAYTTVKTTTGNAYRLSMILMFK